MVYRAKKNTMTEQEIEKLNNEFSNEFDVLYNNITSNQAPGLDEYEKSVFLTKAQDEIVKAYFNPKTNKVQEGFDGNEKRQIDFSMIMRSKVYQKITVSTVDYDIIFQQGGTLNPGISTFAADASASPILKSPVKLKDTSILTGETPTLTIAKVDVAKGHMVVSDLTTFAHNVDTSHYTVSQGTVSVTLGE